MIKRLKHRNAAANKHGEMAELVEGARLEIVYTL